MEAALRWMPLIPGQVQERHGPFLNAWGGGALHQRGDRWPNDLLVRLRARRYFKRGMHLFSILIDTASCSSTKAVPTYLLTLPITNPRFQER